MSSPKLTQMSEVSSSRTCTGGRGTGSYWASVRVCELGWYRASVTKHSRGIWYRVRLVWTRFNI
ncbi:hypothetical protein DPMN_038501 [Dreissena polymorpha]|uniref:Uncharacterized protein n=1 Tax=Dreissena polymorpha TaxID=45954 RepID=A0A9D4MEC5_DREPO|nr:hypothetical protein DPMN_038501 [Dreissena polymorpha]